MVSGEKRNCDEENSMERINTILLDIEGTTTSISFVKETLFPYVKENLKTYVDSHWNDEEFKTDLKALKLQAKKDEEDKVDNFSPIEEGENEKESVVKNVLWQMDLDRKTTALKQLQGHVWREGYENGQLKGHVYPEVSQTLKKWCEDGRKLYIYSSGSVEAQKLLFKNTESGDLQGFLSGYFDTETGPKTEASSYTNIAKAVGCECSQILFLTDVVKEAVAADKAGLQVMLVVREGNAPLTDDEKKAFTTISSFKDIVLESSNKKKKICEEENEGQETPVVVSTAKTENEAKEEAAETKKEETEKMEVVETSDGKPEDCKQESKTEENGETKTEPATKSPEADSDGIDVDVDDSNGEKESGDKNVSSSVEVVGEEKKEVNGESGKKSTGEAEATATATTEPTEEKPKEEEKVDSTEVTEKTEEKEENKENLKEDTNEKVEKSVNGHENGSHKEENEKEASGEAEESTNGKLEEKEDAVPVKKIPAEEQADSTVEVTA